MNNGVRKLQGTRAAEFVIAAASPVSLDSLVDWEVARPSELWAWLQDSRKSGRIAEDQPAGAGCFSLLDLSGQEAILVSAGAGDWAWLLEQEGVPAAVLVNARRAADERRLGVAARLFRGLVCHASPERVPGGREGWSELVVECARRDRFSGWLHEELIERAIGIAVERGNLASQAILWGVHGFCSMRAGRLAEGRASLERGLETARAINSRPLSFEVHLQAAYAQSLEGQALEAIATFERFLGDLPEELVPLPPELTPPFEPFPETALAVLGSTYGQVGQYGRALDLLHRLRAAGRRTSRPELTALAETFLAGVYSGRRELQPAAEHALSAFRFWQEHPGAPYFQWHASISLGWALVSEDRLDEARDVLALGQRARVASGLMYFGGSALFETLDRIDLLRAAPPAGLSIEVEIERMLAWRDGYMRASAHRFRALRLARAAGPAPEAPVVAAVDAHLQQALSILRASRAGLLELARTCEQAAEWSAARARPEEAGRLEAEARRIRASIEHGPGVGSEADLALALLDLGRLALHPGGDGAWGEIAARLCANLGFERCALLEDAGEGPRAVAARGGGRRWVASMEAILRATRPSEPLARTPEPEEDHTASPFAQLLIVPFASSNAGRPGWAALETRYNRALLSPSNRRALDVLGLQLGVLAENLAVWKELLAARQRLEQENRYYRQDPATPASGGRIVGNSPALQRTLDLVGRVAPTSTTVLIQGETGVGKELIAREIHRLSPRARGPFIAVHIASFAPGLVASSLFGHERGAFTGAVEQTRGRFELADGGTLFLDEVGELTLEDQVRLLRVLQEGIFERVGGTRPLKSDFRLVAATNRDLAAAVREGRFREDLFFRLSAFPVEVPPLRERREEIPTLALYFMEAANRKLARAFEGISEADMDRLVAYRWPGNVRELEHLIERAAILSEPPRLRIPPLQDAFEPELSSTPAVFLGTLEDAEREYFRHLIQRTRGRVAGQGGAAEIAGLKASTLNWHIERLGLKGELQRARLERSGAALT